MSSSDQRVGNPDSAVEEEGEELNLALGHDEDEGDKPPKPIQDQNQQQNPQVPVNLQSQLDQLVLDTSRQQATVPTREGDHLQQIEDTSTVVFSLFLQILLFLPTVDNLSPQEAFDTFAFTYGLSKVSSTSAQKIFKMTWLYHIASRRTSTALSSSPQFATGPQTVVLSTTQEEQTFAAACFEDIKGMIEGIVQDLNLGDPNSNLSESVLLSKMGSFYGDDRPTLVLLLRVLEVSVYSLDLGLPPIVIDAANIFFPYFIHSLCASSCYGVVNDSMGVPALIVSKIRSTLKDPNTSSFHPWKECAKVLNFGGTWYNKRESFRGLLISFAFILGSLKLIHRWGRVTVKNVPWPIIVGYMWGIIEDVLFPRFRAVLDFLDNADNIGLTPADRVKGAIDKISKVAKEDGNTIKTVVSPHPNTKSTFYNGPCVYLGPTLRYIDPNSYLNSNYPSIPKSNGDQKFIPRIMGATVKHNAWNDDSVVAVARSITLPGHPSPWAFRPITTTDPLPPTAAANGTPGRGQTNANNTAKTNMVGRRPSSPPPPVTPANTAQADSKPTVPDDSHHVPLSKSQWISKRDDFLNTHGNDKSLVNQVNLVKYLKFHDYPNPSQDAAYHATTHTAWYCPISKKYAPKLNAHKKSEWITLWGCPYCNFMGFTGKNKVLDHAQSACQYWGKAW